MLILDRDKNPRDCICDRLERLDIAVDSERFWVWDCQQNAEPPQPDSLIIVNCVKRMVAETGKSSLIIADSLVKLARRNGRRSHRLMDAPREFIGFRGGSGLAVGSLKRGGRGEE